MKETHPDYNSPTALKKILELHGMSMQKKFGQNFLINASVRKSLIDVLDIGTGSHIWEIGAGLGSMTAEILSRGASVTAFEIDHGFSMLLTDFFSGYGKNFCLIEGDVLKTWKEQFDSSPVPDRLFGNLPYNIAATFIGNTIEHKIRFEKAVVTVQKEVALRMTANPGSKNYSSFSVLCQWAYDISSVMELSCGNFWPRPNVDSRSVLMKRKTDFPSCRNPDLFMKLQRSLFSSRRKTVKNNLSVFLSDSRLASEILEKTEIDPQARAETLSLKELLLLSDNADTDIIRNGI